RRVRGRRSGRSPAVPGVAAIGARRIVQPRGRRVARVTTGAAARCAATRYFFFLTGADFDAALGRVDASARDAEPLAARFFAEPLSGLFFAAALGALAAGLSADLGALAAGLSAAFLAGAFSFPAALGAADAACFLDA